jgi:hypothetical protein
MRPTEVRVFAVPAFKYAAPLISQHTLQVGNKFLAGFIDLEAYQTLFILEDSIDRVDSVRHSRVLARNP